jgi:acyl dehydratase
VAVERFPVEEGAILAFARAIGDPNPIYTDRQHAAASEIGSILAPPTFVQSSAQFDPDYVLRPKIGEPWFGSGKTATGIERETGLGAGLHAEQHYTYHRPVRAGDVLTAAVRPGDTWEKEGRSGKLRFSETITEYRTLDGELVVTARSVGVMTEGPGAKEA